MSNLSPGSLGSTSQPLAARIWPGNLAQYIGQQHLLIIGKPLPYAIEARRLYPIVPWGLPGTGRTVLAEVIVHYANADVERTSTITSGVKEIREAIERARQSRNAGRRTILFVDEVHRLNKSQQDAFLPHTEDDTIIFIGATTGDPSFELNSTLLSRARVYLLKSLSTGDVEQVLTQAMEDRTRGYGDQDIILPDETRRAIAKLMNGDVHRALNTLEVVADMVEVDDNGKWVLKFELLIEIAGERSARSDNKGDRFYDLISALYKSVRGSAPDVTLYWYARTIAAGGDPLCVTRRCPAIAPEDVGSTDPRAMQMVIVVWDCFTHVGPVEGERIITQAIAYLAYAPKSSAIYTALKAVLAGVRERLDYDVPIYLRDAPTKSMKEVDYGQEYCHAHDEANAYVADEVYFLSEIAQTRYYLPANRGLEDKTGEKFAWLIEQD